MHANGDCPDQIKGIGLTGQMHGMVILDENGMVLRPAILWNDQRTQKQCDDIREKIGKEAFIKITGNDALTGFTAPKILWVKDEEPLIYKKIRHVLLPKDFVRYKLTGEYAMDRAGGSGTVLFNLADRNWSLDLIKRLGMQKEWFPPTYEGTEVTGYLTEESAESLGLVSGIPVFGGGGGSGGRSGGDGNGGGRHPVDQPGHIRGGFCRDGPRLYRTAGPAACILPCGSRKMAFDGRHAFSCRQLALVPRHIQRK